MSQEQPITGNQAGPRRQISIPFKQIARNPAVNLIGLPELIGLLGAALLAVMVVFAYLYFYIPAQSRLTSIELERTRLQAQVQSARTQYKENDTTNHTVGEIN